MNHETEVEKAVTASMGFELVVLLDKRRVAHLLCTAFEGGSNYWYQIEEFIPPAVANNVKHLGDGFYRHIDYPLCIGGALMVSDRRACNPGEMKTTRLDWPRIREGLGVMALKHPRHFANWLAEKDDAETGDVFLQCCVLGDVVYG
jgi:hypothetical protein